VREIILYSSLAGPPQICRLFSRICSAE